MIPPAILCDRELASKLPLFFRALEGEPHSEEKLDEVVGDPSWADVKQSIHRGP